MTVCPQGLQRCPTSSVYHKTGLAPRDPSSVPVLSKQFLLVVSFYDCLLAGRIQGTPVCGLWTICAERMLVSSQTPSPESRMCGAGQLPHNGLPPHLNPPPTWEEGIRWCSTVARAVV